MKILIINGPNINMLGKRESIYGDFDYKSIIEYTERKCNEMKLSLDWWQSNSESEIIEKIQTIEKKLYDGLIINPAAYSHTSIAILDALLTLKVPIVETHLTNVYNRETFRHSMLTAKASSIIMSGLGKDAYYFAALALIEK